MDLREQLQATWDDLSGKQPPEPVTGAADAETGAAAAPPESADNQPQPESAAQAAPDRDENGRFKAKAQPETPEAGADAAAATDAQQAEPAPAAGAETQETGSIRVPHALPAPLKAKFKDLPAEWRDAFSRQEDSIKAFKDEQAPKATRLNRYDEIIGPHLDRWRLAGLDEFSGIQTLIAAQNVLERNPVEGLLHIARSYGVDLRALAAQGLQQRSTADGQSAMTATPELQHVLQPLVQQVQTLQQQLQQSQQMSEMQKLAEAQSEVETFRSDPKNLYFENVREDVARLLDTGAANTLQEAYERAVWASPEIRPLLLAEQAQQAQADTQRKAQEAAARTKAQTAQKAAGSVTGAPAPGAQAPKGPVGSIRDTLVQAAQEVGWQV